MNDDQPFSILLIEDNPGDTRLLREMLVDASDVPFDLECVERLSEGMERLAEGGIDVVLLDLSLPDSQGLETFALVHECAPHVPITVLSGLDDATMAVTAVRQGAQDYLVKGQFDCNLLVRAIRYAIERKQAEEEIRRRAAHLEALNAVIAAATTASELSELLGTALEHTLQALGLESGAPVSMSPGASDRKLAGSTPTKLWQHPWPCSGSLPSPIGRTRLPTRSWAESRLQSSTLTFGLL